MRKNSVRLEERPSNDNSCKIPCLNDLYNGSNQLSYKNRIESVSGTWANVYKNFFDKLFCDLAKKYNAFNQKLRSKGKKKKTLLTTWLTHDYESNYDLKVCVFLPFRPMPVDFALVKFGHQIQYCDNSVRSTAHE